MGMTREPLNIDFIVDSRALTKQEEVAISEFIKAEKANRSLILKNQIEISGVFAVQELNKLNDKTLSPKKLKKSKTLSNKNKTVDIISSTT